MEDYPKIVILDFNNNSREVLKQFVQELCPDYEVQAFGDYKQGLEFIKTQEVSPLVFLDITNSQKFNKDINEIKLFTSKIIVTSADYSTDMIVKAMRFGAKDFLPKPIIKEDLKRVLNFAVMHQNDDNLGSKIIAIYSNKGGIGKTTLAVNLAVELSKTTGDKVALIDLNLQLGDVSTFLNLNPTFDVSYAIRNLVSKKDETVLSVFEKYNDSNLYILSDPTYIEESECISPYQVGELFKNLRKVFPYIVIDMSSNIDPISLKILDDSDFIFFTTIVNIPAIRNCQRCLNLFKSRKFPDDKIKILINRYMENDDIKIEDIENALGEKIYWKIPNNYFSIMEAINKGVPVSDVNSNSNIANSFRDLAGKIADNIVEQTIIKYRGR